jgi:lipopolysaccharide transport system permease protein
MLARIAEVWSYRSMLWSLVLSELRTRYKGSFLGFLWTFVNPLLTLVVYTLVFSTIMKVSIPHYAAFMFIGLLGWNLFAQGVQSSSSVVVRQGSIVKKIYFPREILPLSVVGAALINYAFSLIILVPFLLINGLFPTVYWLFLPLILLLLALFTSGLGMLVAALNVYFRDIEHMLGIFLMLWFYLTPVVYSINMISPRYAAILKLNPVADFVMGLQSIFYEGQSPHWKALIYGAIGAGVAFLVGAIIFYRLSRRFAEEV